MHADIDECVSLNETCLDENTHCVNSVGNFSCQCDPGFTGDGYNCSGQLIACFMVTLQCQLFCLYMYIVLI